MARNRFLRFQFRLRTLLLVVTLAGSVCAAVVPAIREQQWRRHDEELMQALKKCIVDLRPATPEERRWHREQLAAAEAKDRPPGNRETTTP